MHKKRNLFFLSMLLGLCSCTKQKEMPPMVGDFDSAFVLETPKPITYDERVYVDQRRKEYNQAIGNNN